MGFPVIQAVTLKEGNIPSLYSFKHNTLAAMQNATYVEDDIGKRVRVLDTIPNSFWDITHVDVNGVATFSDATPKFKTINGEIITGVGNISAGSSSAIYCPINILINGTTPRLLCRLKIPAGTYTAVIVTMGASWDASDNFIQFTIKKLNGTVVKNITITGLISTVEDTGFTLTQDEYLDFFLSGTQTSGFYSCLGFQFK
jgi:hypothetical protein